MNFRGQYIGNLLMYITRLIYMCICMIRHRNTAETRHFIKHPRFTSRDINICTHPRHTTLEACLSLTCYCKHVRQALQQRARFVGLQANFLHVLALYLFQILHSFTVLIILLNLGYSCCQQGQARYFCKRKLKVAECTLVYIRKRPRDMSQ